MRNLGHELAGVRLKRIQERKRVMGVLARRGKLAALQRGRAQVHTLWRTGLLPAAAHGAGASGV
eukprot:4446202-Pyramimonas_sp.AAC.1